MLDGSKEQLSQEVKTLRSEMGWTQEELARHIDVSVSTVQRWELRKASPSRLAQRALSKLFRRAGINSG